MFSISSNNIITLSRGDTFDLEMKINLGTSIEPEYYPLQDDDKVYFGLMEPHQPFEDALIRKIFTKDDLDFEGKLIMSFNSEDTEFLMPGNYYYMIKLVRYSPKGSGEDPKEIVSTLVSKTKFIIIDQEIRYELQ